MIKKIRKILFVLFIVSWGCSWLTDCSNLLAQEPKPTEYQVKAAFIYNFLQFIDWPIRPGKAPNPALNLYILGENSFGGAFEPYQGETIRGRKFFIRQGPLPHELKDCQLVFIGPSEKGRITQIAKQFNDLGILTIGDSEGMARHGVMINFYVERGKVRFEINIDAALRAGFTISSHILKLAKIIQEPS